MEDADKDFSSHVKAGDLIVAEANFGYGSSREQELISAGGLIEWTKKRIKIY